MSWVPGADGSIFPIQNLPFGVFSHAASGREPRIGVAIGDFVVDMKQLSSEGLLDGLSSCTDFGEPTLNSFMARTRAEWREARSRLAELLSTGGADSTLANSADLKGRCLVARSEVAMHLPCKIGDYTDFYSSREHASNVGTMFRGPDNALQPNWLHLPVGYHGRASSVVVHDTPVVRPKGQLQIDRTDATKGSTHDPCRLFDFELEMGFFVGGAANPMGAPVSMAEAEDRIFGFVLCNDWSARDVQKFEYVPLGPFGAKNFATTISPWIVMLDALEPFKCATSAGEQTEPVPLEYLRDPTYSSYDVALTVEITPEAGGEPTAVSKSNYRHMYWTCKQQLVHHSVTGCNMQPGDMLASGTISGTDASAFGSMLELCWQGTKDVGPLSDGTTRKFLKDGDYVNMTGVCTHPSGYKIGFGDCGGKVLPANSPPPVEAPPPFHAVLNDVVLSSYWRSSCSWRVRVALAHYNVPFSYKAVNLLEGKQKEVSHMAQVPRLDWTDGGGNAHSLTQSLAIIEMLIDSCPCGPSLHPNNVVEKARAREIAEVINAGTQPLQNLGHIKAMQGDIPTDVFNARAVAKAAIEKGLAAVEILLAANNDPRHCVGSHISVADLCLVPQLYNARRFEVDLAPYPRALAIEAHLQTLPAFIAADPAKQPDAVA